MVKIVAFLAALGLFLSSTPQALAESNYDTGVRYYQQKSYATAANYFSKAISAQPQNPTAYYYEGLCFQQLGQAEQARQVYSVLASTFPASKEAALVQPVLKALSGSSGNGSQSKRTNRSATASEPTMTVSGNGGISDAEWKRLPDEATVALVRSTTNHQFVDASINGHPIRLMFDTGAEMCCLARSDLEQLGLKMDSNAQKTRVSGAGGTQEAHIINAEISLGAITRRVPIYVFDQSVGFAILGAAFFNVFNYQIDNSSGMVHFVKKQRPGMASSVYESSDVIAIPYQPMGNDMLVQAKVNGKTIPMIFDTGAFAVCFSLTSAMMLGLQIPEDAKMMTTSGAGGSTRAMSFPVDRIELGPIIKSRIPIVVNQSASPPFPLLGQPFFGDRRYTIDTEHHLIKFVH